MSGGALVARTAPARPGLTPLAILGFFIPVAAWTMFIAVIFNVINSSLARSADAAQALAAFAVGQALGDMVGMPASSSHNWLIARGRDRRSFWHGLRVLMPLVAAGCLALALMAWPPLGGLVYGRLLGAPAGLWPHIAAVLWVAVPLPVVLVVRGACQNVLMLVRKPQLMTAGVVVRLCYTVVMATMLLRREVPGALVGAILWVTGMAVEALFDLAMAWRVYDQYPVGEAGAELPPAGAIWRFLLPLIATNLCWSLGKPVLNAGLSRTLTPERSIAVFQMASYAAWLLLAYAQNGYRKAVVVFWHDRQTLAALNRFGVFLASTITVLMLAATASGGAAWFLSHVVGAPGELVRPATAVLLAMSWLPLPLVATEMHLGRLLRSGNTRSMGVAKGASILAIVATVLLLSRVVPGAGAMVGVTGMSAGILAEWWVARQAAGRLGGIPAGD